MSLRTPYADAVARHAARDLALLNVPGHAADPGAAPLLAEFFGEQLLRLDVEPLLDGIDKGDGNGFDDAVSLAAAAWGARRTWFLTNGASQANRTTVLALSSFRGPDETIVAQRSMHSSVIDGLILGGAEPRFVLPSIDARYGVNHGITPETLAAEIEKTDAKAGYVVSPSYFGAVSDIAGLAQVCHDAGIPLIVDAAWGSHFGFHPDLPANPLALGADVVVSSTHKMGGALTQAAMLHLADGPFADELEPLIERAFRLTQSTSESALLLASLDLARATLETGQDRIGASIDAAERLRSAIRATGRFAIVSDTFEEFPDIVAHDPLRVSIDVHKAGFDGHAVREELMRSAGVFLEISTDACIVAFIGPGVVPDIDRVVSAITALEPTPDLAIRPAGDDLALPRPADAVMRPRTAAFASTALVPYEEAIGRVSADSLAAYPPGIPNVIPGELITRETIDFLRTIAATPGGYVRGAADPLLDTVRVVETPLTDRR